MSPKPPRFEAPYGYTVERCLSQKHALTLWLEHALFHGKAAHGAIFRRRFADLEGISELCGQMMPKYRSVWTPERRQWDFRNGSNLCLRGLENLEEAWNYAGNTFTMLIFDAAPEWQDDYLPLQYMTVTLRSAQDVPCRLLTVGEICHAHR
jgi:hypothetical protein